jgi:DNA processing protein
MEEIACIKKGDVEYPALLEEIASPPRRLYCRGNIPLLNGGACVAVVGTRKASRYGMLATQKIVRELAGYGVIIISGLAYGIDAAAHRAALDCGGLTIAVVPGGVDGNSVYPRGHESLAEKIAAKGLVVSEMPTSSRIYPSSFLARNRIIAGLCVGTVVVECEARSGALMTARYARDENRGVYAVPGSIFSPTSVGTNLLLSRGGMPVQSGLDVLKDLNLIEAGHGRRSGGAPGLGGEAKLSGARPKLKQNFTASEQLVLQCIQSGTAAADEIIAACEQAGQSKAQTLAALTTLELAGAILAGTAGEYYLT